jgi:Domain of unknown function (DUF4920)
MKTLILSLAIAFTAVTGYAQKFDTFGKKIKASGSQPVEQLKAESLPKEAVKVEGEVESVCQAAGCWMKIKMADGKTMRVTFKDYGFFVPKDLAGTKVVFEGLPEVKTTSVADLRHYAEDAGKSKEEIAKITEPKVELTFVADGVLVPKK